MWHDALFDCTMNGNKRNREYREGGGSRKITRKNVTEISHLSKKNINVK